MNQNYIPNELLAPQSVLQEDYVSTHDNGPSDALEAPQSFESAPEEFALTEPTGLTTHTGLPMADLSSDEATVTPAEQPEQVIADSKTVSLEMDYTSEEKKGHINIGDDGIPFPAQLAKHSEKNIEERFRADNHPQTAIWGAINLASTEATTMPHDFFSKSLARPGAQYKQYLQTETGKISYSSPKLADSKVASVRGEKAMLRARALMGLGGIISIPLYHSGFWLTIVAPLESDYIELNRRISDEKISMGRTTHGLAFANNEAFMTGWLIDFLIRHKYETNLKNEEDLRSKISALDIPTAIWALALAMYPRGFNYTRSLTTKEGIDARETVTALINVAKLLWVDNSYLSPRQKAHMANRQPQSITDDALSLYKADFPLSGGRDIEVIEGITVTVQIPTVTQQVDSCHRWLIDLNGTIDETFTTTQPDAAERNRLIETHTHASQLRHYAGWISKITVEGTVLDTPAQIENMLESMSENQDMSKVLIDGVKSFIEDATFAIIAIPETTGKETGLPRFPYLIPIDVPSVFFILLVQRINRMVSRQSLV